MQESKAIDGCYEPAASAATAFYTSQLSPEVTPDASRALPGASSLGTAHLAERDTAASSSQFAHESGAVSSQTAEAGASGMSGAGGAGGASGPLGVSGSLGRSVEKDARDVMREAVRRGAGARHAGVPVSIPEEESTNLSAGNSGACYSGMCCRGSGHARGVWWHEQQWYTE
jgi:hypothetical protein